MNFDTIDKWIDENFENMKNDLAKLVSFASITIPEEELEKPRRDKNQVDLVLDAALEIAEGMGFETTNANYNYGFADFKGTAALQSENLVGVLGHLDVVPVNKDDWESDPFTLRCEDGKLYARGTIDDKGPMLAAVYAAYALKCAGLKPTKTLRLIFGVNEETTMSDAKKYCKEQMLPSCGFTPDADWPVIIGEKGIMHFSFKASWDGSGANMKPYLVSLKAGEAINSVPSKAVATFILPDGNTQIIEADGVTAHGSTPWLGDNALTKLLAKLSDYDFAPEGAKIFIDELTKIFEDDKYGKGIGVDGTDEHTVTTASPNLLSVDEAGGHIQIDMRFIVSDKLDKYEEIIDSFATSRGWESSYEYERNPLLVGEDEPFVVSMLNAYRQVTGEAEAKPIYIGGGTYAKAIPNFVAFGPGEADDMRAHKSNEYISCDELIEATKIYARAIYELIK